jgi:hypothetical protein
MFIPGSMAVLVWGTSTMKEIYYYAMLPFIVVLAALDVRSAIRRSRDQGRKVEETDPGDGQTTIARDRGA